MSFARFLKTRPTDLSGISVYQPNFEALQGLLEGQQQGFDVSQALVDKIPEHLASDRAGVMELSEGLQKEMDDVTGIFTDEGVGAGNLALRNLTRQVRKMYEPGGQYYQVAKNKEIYDQQKQLILDSAHTAEDKLTLIDKFGKDFSTFIRDDRGKILQGEVNLLSTQPIVEFYDLNKLFGIGKQVVEDTFGEVIPIKHSDGSVTYRTTKMGTVSEKKIRDTLDSHYKGDVKLQEYATSLGKEDQVEAMQEAVINAYKKQSIEQSTTQPSGGRTSTKTMKIPRPMFNIHTVTDRTAFGEQIKEMDYNELYSYNRDLTEGIVAQKNTLEKEIAEKPSPYASGDATITMDSAGNYQLNIPEGNFDGLTGVDRLKAKQEHEEWVITHQNKLAVINSDMAKQEVLDKSITEFNRTLTDLGIDVAAFEDVDTSLSLIDKLDMFNWGEKQLMKLYTLATKNDGKGLDGIVNRLLGDELVYELVQDLHSKGLSYKEIEEKVGELKDAGNDLERQLKNQSIYSRPQVSYMIDSASEFSPTGKTKIISGIQSKLNSSLDSDKTRIEFLTTGEPLLGDEKVLEAYKAAVAAGDIKNAEIMFDDVDGQAMMVINTATIKDKDGNSQTLPPIQIPLEDPEVGQYLEMAHIPQDAMLWHKTSNVSMQLKNQGFAHLATTEGRARLKKNRAQQIEAVIPTGSESFEKTFDTALQATEAITTLNNVAITIQEKGFPSETSEDYEFMINLFAQVGFTPDEVELLLSNLRL